MHTQLNVKCFHKIYLAEKSTVERKKSIINNSKIYFELTDSRVFHIRHVREGVFVFHEVMHENIDIINCIDPIGELDRHLKAHMRFVAQFRENHWNHRSRKV